MSGHSADIAKQGYVKYQSKHLGVWKKRWLILRKKSARGEARIEKYVDEESSFNFDQEIKSTVIELRYILEVARLQESVRKHGITITDQAKVIQFSADSELEANRWLEAINETMKTGGRMQNTFKVYLMKHVSVKASGEVTLFVAADKIRLLDVHSQREIVAWNFSHLRRYGVERGMFTLEAGRSSSTGEGVFLFETDDPESVYQSVHAASQALARGAPLHMEEPALNNQNQGRNDYSTARNNMSSMDGGGGRVNSGSRGGSGSGSMGDGYYSAQQNGNYGGSRSEHRGGSRNNYGTSNNSDSEEPYSDIPRTSFKR